MPEIKDIIRLRKADEHDLTLMLAWRNNPIVYQGFYTQSKTNHINSWEEHLAWWKSRPTSWHTFIIVLTRNENSRPIGVVNVGQCEHWSPEIGFYVGSPSDWGKGYCKEAILQTLTWIKHSLHRDYTHTTVLKSNERSIKLLESIGFLYMAEARPGEIWMAINLAKML